MTRRSKRALPTASRVPRFESMTETTANTPNDPAGPWAIPVRRPLPGDDKPKIADQFSAQGVEPARRDQGCARADLPAAVLRRAVRPARRTPQRRAAGQRRRAADRTRRRGQRTACRGRYLHRTVGQRPAQGNPRPRCRSFARNRRERQAHHLGRARPRPLPRRRAGFARRNRQRDRQGPRQEKAGAGLCHRLHHRQLPDRIARQRNLGRQRRRRRDRRSRRIAPLLQRLDGPARASPRTSIASAPSKARSNPSCAATSRPRRRKPISPMPACCGTIG